jgi:hypothetical protein
MESTAQITVKILNRLHTFELRYDAYDFHLYYEDAEVIRGYYDYAHYRQPADRLHLCIDTVSKSLELFYPELKIIICNTIRKNKEIVKNIRIIERKKLSEIDS